MSMEYGRTEYLYKKKSFQSNNIARIKQQAKLG